MRLDVMENHRLDKIIDWNDWQYMDILWIIHDFINDVLIGQHKLKEINVSASVIERVIYYSDIIKKYLDEDIDNNELNKQGTQAMQLVDALDGVDKIVIDAIKIGLGDSERACFPEYDAGFLFGVMLSDLYRLNDCSIYKYFGEFISQHPKTQKHKFVSF